MSDHHHHDDGKQLHPGSDPSLSLLQEAVESTTVTGATTAASASAELEGETLLSVHIAGLLSEIDFHDFYERRDS